MLSPVFLLPHCRLAGPLRTRVYTRPLQDASTFLPYGGDIQPEKAFEIIEEYKAKVEAVRTTQVMAAIRTYEVHQ